MVTITRVLRRRAQQAGLGLLTAEELRRTAIHDLLEAGHSLQAVQRRFGLVDVVTLARYDHRDLNDPRWYQGWFESQKWIALQ